MRAIGLLCLVAGALYVGPAAAINKCTGPDGKITFQDAPCTGQGERLDVKPASGRAPPSGSPVAPPSTGKTEAQRLEGIVADSQRDRRRLDLRDRLLPDAEAAVASHRFACEQRQKKLAASQYAYRQNLYGKTHAAQVASEMAAAAATCDTKDRELTANVDALAKECAALKCR